MLKKSATPNTKVSLGCLLGANSNRLGQAGPLLSQHQSTGAEGHGSQNDHDDTGHPTLARRIASTQATNREIRSKNVDENERRVHREIHGCTALAERLKRLLRSDSMLLANLPKQDPHAAILRLSRGLQITRPIMGVHIPNGQFRCEL